MTGKLNGKVAIVTGACSGIGEATALGLAGEGAKRTDRLESLTKRIQESGSEVLSITADVADEGIVRCYGVKTKAEWLKTILAIATTMLLLVISPGMAQAKTPVPVAVSQSSDYADFQQRINNYFAAWSKTTDNFNVETAAQFYVKDKSLFVWDILPPLKGYVGLEEYKTEIEKNAYDNFINFQLTANNDLRVTRRGEIAWTTVSFHASGKLKNGRPINLDGRLTNIWLLQDGKWLIVHEHSSIPLSN